MENGMPDNENFYSIFIGEYIQATTDVMVESHEQIGEDIFAVRQPLLVRGYLLDADLDYLFMGPSIGEIAKVTQSVQRSRVVHVMIIDPNSELDTLLDRLPVPDEEKEVN